MNNEQDEALVPVGVGNAPAQQRFLQGHHRYLAEVPKLVELCNKIFNRTLAPPDANERQALLDANLPDDDIAVVAWEDRVTASNLIFHFGLMACDDFNAVAILSGNGAGFAALIIVRSMYERLVTAMYIAKKPSEARCFAESSPIYKLNYLKRADRMRFRAVGRFEPLIVGLNEIVPSMIQLPICNVSTNVNAVYGESCNSFKTCK